MFSRIIATGSYLPNTIRTNADLEKIVDTSDEWILTRTGIKERRIADENETVASMATQASIKALQNANIDANDIDLIIVGTTTNSHAYPSAACLVQKNLGIENAIAFDVAAACTGFIYALSVADKFIKTKVAKKALVIGADINSRALNIEDRSTLVLFGDGAGCVILEENAETGILSTHLHSSPDNEECLVFPNYRDQINFIQMKGNATFKVAVEKLSSVVTEVLDHNNLEKKDIDWLVPHQANLRIISATAKKLEMDLSQVVITLDKYANNSAATIPVALDEAVRDGRIKKNQLLLLEAFGGGWTWGAVLVRF